MSKAYWSIVDRDNCVVGSWTGPVHYVGCYEKYSQAKLDAIARKIPQFTIANSVWAMRLPPSQYSFVWSEPPDNK